METRVPCKAWETHAAIKSMFLTGNFGPVAVTAVKTIINKHSILKKIVWDSGQLLSFLLP